MQACRLVEIDFNFDENQPETWRSCAWFIKKNHSLLRSILAPPCLNPRAIGYPRVTEYHSLLSKWPGRVAAIAGTPKDMDNCCAHDFKQDGLRTTCKKGGDFIEKGLCNTGRFIGAWGSGRVCRCVLQVDLNGAGEFLFAPRIYGSLIGVSEAGYQSRFIIRSVCSSLPSLKTCLPNSTKPFFL